MTRNAVRQVAPNPPYTAATGNTGATGYNFRA